MASNLCPCCGQTIRKAKAKAEKREQVDHKGRLIIRGDFVKAWEKRLERRERYATELRNKTSVDWLPEYLAFIAIGQKISADWEAKCERKKAAIEEARDRGETPESFDSYAAICTLDKIMRRVRAKYCPNLVSGKALNSQREYR
jgi:hypothetical protein